VDNKWNLVTRLQAVQAFIETVGKVPANIKFVVDGEEETGSPNLEPIVKKYRQLFLADAVIREFGGADRRGRPHFYLGLKESYLSNLALKRCQRRSLC